MVYISKKKGFTLVEMMIVISIVAMLSVMSVNGYLSYRRSALVNLSAENIVSQISAMKSDSTYGGGSEERKDEIKLELGGGVSGGGVTSAEGTYKCYGVSFVKDEDVFLVGGFSQYFNGKKVWGGDAEGWVYEGCGAVNGGMSAGGAGSVQERPFELDPQIFVKNFSFSEGSGGHCSDNLFIRFIPPNGNAEASCGGSNFKGVDKDSVIMFDVSYGKEASNPVKKTITLNLSNLIAEIK
ncbi:MAG: type II secretion system protein [Patescibacteria group bacterium]